MFKVGDRVKITPTTRRGWIDKMEAYVGMVGKVLHAWPDDYCVVFESGRGYFYYECDLTKVNKFKGNKHATAS